MSILKKHDYVFDIFSLKRVNEFIDLCLLVNNQLSWDEPIEFSIKKAYLRLGFIKRCIGYTCHLDVKKSLIKLESAQRWSTNYILANNNLDYKSRLAVLELLLPLSPRRDFQDCNSCIIACRDWPILM